MLRYLYIIVVILTVNSCAGQKAEVNSKKETRGNSIYGEFAITKIDSTTSYYLIYCSKDEKSYQIISKKVNDKNTFSKIELGKKYLFELNEFLQTTNDNPLTGFSSADPCFFLDDKTEICREKDVFGPYVTKNLAGIYYVKN